MPKKFFKRISPSAESLKKHKCLGILGKALYSPILWQLNRKSVALATAIGLFMMWVPIPSQMVYAAIVAILLRANLPISVAMVWISNPITIPPMFYFAYLFGAKVLDQPPLNIEFEMTWEWLTVHLSNIWEPLLLGCLMLGVISAVIGYFSVHLLWRLHIIRRIQERKLKRKQRR